MNTTPKNTRLNNDAPWWQKYLPHVLFGLAFLLYANTLGNSYNMDDELVTRGHKLTSKGISAIGEIFRSPYYSDNMGYAYGYRPMVHVSFALEHQFFGDNPQVSHFFNVLLYGLCVLFLFRLLTMWAGEKNRLFAALATLLFVLHPVHVEVVASIKNRDELLALLFGLLSGIAFSKGTQKQNWLQFLLASAWFFLALLSKKSMYPLAMVYPLALVILYNYPLKKILLYALFLVIPAGLLVSERQPERIALLTVFPFVLILGVYYFKRLSVRPLSELKATFRGRVADYRVVLLLWAGFLAWAAVTHNLVVLALAFLLNVVLFRVKKEWATPLLISGLCISGAFISGDFAYVAFAVSAHYLVENLRKKDRGLWLAAALFAAASGIFLARDFDWGKPGFALAIFLLFFLSDRFPQRRVWEQVVLWGAVLVSTPLSLLYGGSVFVPAILLVIAVYRALPFIRARWAGHPHWMLLGFVLLGFAFTGVKDVNYARKTRIAAEQPVPVPTAKNELAVAVPPQKLKEGRKLEFAENTLVAPHTVNETLGTGAVTLGEYLRLMVFPAELSFYYGYSRIDTSGTANPWVWVSLLTHAGLLVLALWQMRKRPLFSVGIVWYMLGIGLFSNWVELVAGMLGERLAFTASAGFCIALAGVLLWLKPGFSFRKPALVEIVSCVLLLGFGFRTLVRNTDWKDAVTLMGNDITHLENSAQANNLYALNLMQASFDVKKYNPQQQFNMRKLAVVHFDRALQIWPGFFNAAYDKGRSAQMIGDVPGAIDGFEKAAAMKHTDFMDPNYQLSDLYLKTGRYPDFLRNAKAIFEVEHTRPEAYNLVARGFFLNARADSAKIYLRKGLQLYPADAGLKNNMAEIFKMEGQPDSAAYYLSK